jgi:hypothetical protein
VQFNDHLPWQVLCSTVTGAVGQLVESLEAAAFAQGKGQGQVGAKGMGKVTLGFAAGQAVLWAGLAVSYAY